MAIEASFEDLRKIFKDHPPRWLPRLLGNLGWGQIVRGILLAAIVITAAWYFFTWVLDWFA
jgi:hypothetical protein